LISRANIAYLHFLNKKHEQRRVAVGKNAKVVDQSMQAVQVVSDDKEDLPVQQIVDNSWKDLTDWQNEDFVYVF
jgi:hypothetical protein